jgi:hypothetical protein
VVAVQDLLHEASSGRDVENGPWRRFFGLRCLPA